VKNVAFDIPGEHRLYGSVVVEEVLIVFAQRSYPRDNKRHILIGLTARLDQGIQLSRALGIDSVDSDQKQNDIRTILRDPLGGVLLYLPDIPSAIA
jgi:hypothetical protein